ncbi:hypothetical protein Vretimale_6080 [Volvox reticuliferus]|uniref:Uncharacterized protein n=1 Tax=Volvox reticuliferus TaxID=1737510 RepID=A0A8J4LLA0_9CHLO|nr:hypothetical protein Vretimale_6080 [Volvox reticuliferus]
MTEGGHPSGPAPRLRIKGKWQSVVRFFSISVAFMVLWILVTSQLGHYSKLFGPQILLQLNLAFYLPSIPVLILSGSLERVLDARLGPIGSIALRLNSGLAGCLSLAAMFPLLPGLHRGDGPLWPLLTAVAMLGGASAVAFSTSYQLVQYFRAADTIGLGVGCVGAGPLVLLVQLALGVGPSPAKWQWIAMYEISAGLIAAGLMSSSSLCGQYWNRLNEAASRGAAAATAGEGAAAVDGADGRVPLLAAADADAAAAAAEADVEVAWHGLHLAAAGGYRGYGSPGSPDGTYTLRPLGSGGARVSYNIRPRLSYRRGPTTAPDPFNIFSLLSPELDGGFDWEDDVESTPPVLLRRAASAGPESSSSRMAAAARRREALAAAGLARRRTGGSPDNTTLYSQYAVTMSTTKPITPPSSPEPQTVPAAATAAAVNARATPAVSGDGGDSVGGGRAAAATLSTPQAALYGMMSAPANMIRHSNAAKAVNGVRDGDDTAAVPGLLEFGIPDEEPVVQSSEVCTAADHQSRHQRKPSCGTAASSFASATASELLIKALQAPEAARVESSAPSLAPSAALDGQMLPSESLDEATLATDTENEEPAAAVVVTPAVTVTVTVPPPLSLQQEIVEVLRGSWKIMLGFTVDVTLLYIVFPFFTYVPTSGWLGDSLPQVLFYARLFTDLAGRLLPRRRALQLRSGTAILILAAISTAAGALFFAYILAPPHLVARAPRLLRNDAVPLALVVFLWLAGGYTNTMSNMLAPSLVAPCLAGRASALMALLFNVAHIGGLIIAAAMAAAIFGDVVG